jgi:hypothetical protein
MTPQRAQALLDRIATGELRVGTKYEWIHENMSPRERALLSADGEVLAWETYRRFAASVEPKAGFGRDGVCNGPEYRRRRVLMGMFSLVEFRSQDDEIRELFQRSVGQVSLQELMRFLGARMPHFYYAWAFDVLPASKITFGKDALSGLAGSPDHVRTFRHLDRLKQDLLAVRRVMES